VGSRTSLCSFCRSGASSRRRRHFRPRLRRAYGEHVRHANHVGGSENLPTVVMTFALFTRSNLVVKLGWAQWRLQLVTVATGFASAISGDCIRMVGNTLARILIALLSLVTLFHPNYTLVWRPCNHPPALIWVSAPQRDCLHGGRPRPNRRGRTATAEDPRKRARRGATRHRLTNGGEHTPRHRNHGITDGCSCLRAEGGIFRRRTLIEQVHRTDNPSVWRCGPCFATEIVQQGKVQINGRCDSLRVTTPSSSTTR